MTTWFYITAVLIFLAIAGIVYFGNTYMRRNTDSSTKGMSKDILKMKYESGLLTKREYKEREMQISYNNHMSSSYGAIRVDRVL